jgi:hypothetical protein
MAVNKGTFIFECPAGCGAVFSLPAEIMSPKPASLGQIEFTIRMSANNVEGERYRAHMLSHWDMDDED